jgi:hypothetical protein
MKYNISHDLGETFEIADERVLFGSYFFVSEERRELQREVFTLIDLLSKVGGIVSLSNMIFTFLGTMINKQAIVGAIVEQVYYFTP